MPNIDFFPGAFTIELDGLSIVRPIDNGDPKFFARIGSAEAAVFTLRGGRLESEDYVLGRSQIEDRSLLPKQVWWFRKGASPENAQVTFLNDDEADLKILFGGSIPTHNLEYVIAPLLNGSAPPSKVVIKPLRR